MTVLEAIQRSSEFLAGKGVESPRLQVELLLAHLLQLPRLKLYLNFERKVSEPEAEQLRELVKRRGQREPLQHIIGSAAFCGLEFIVNCAVLVPRPETEVLAEKALERLGKNEARKVLDIGTGSGCLAVTLTVKSPLAQICATDISMEALAVARANAERHGVASRINFHPGDLFAGIPLSKRFDLVVTNPPYIPTPTMEVLEPEVRDHDPRLALDGGPDGLIFYRRLAVEATSFLAEAGTFLAEFGDQQQEPVVAIFTEAGWIVEEIVPDLQGKPRIIIACRSKC